MLLIMVNLFEDAGTEIVGEPAGVDADGVEIAARVRLW
jgi:hypothetical protein